MNDNKKLIQLFTPSWLVNFIGVSVGVLVTGFIIVLSRYQGSELREQIFQAQTSGQSDSASVTYNYLTANFADNKFVGALPLLLVWAGVGLMVYFIAMAIAHWFSRAAALHDELEYVHVSRQQLLHETLVELGLRALAIIVWIIFIVLSLRIFIPYAVAAAHVAAQSLSVSSVLFALVAVLILYLDICGHAVCLRFIALKPRLFNF